MARKTNVTKMLCHPGTHAPFCAWHQGAYAMFFTDQDTPPAPQDLKINHLGVTDTATLVWRPVVYVVGNPNENVEVFGEYDVENGEAV